MYFLWLKKVKSFPEEKQKFIKMVKEEGYSTYEITREFGVPNNSIKNWLYSPEKSMSISKRE